MPIICPAILAENDDQYKSQIHNIAKIAHRIQIDLTDGEFASPKTILPTAAWWPVGLRADFHLMYEHPVSAINEALKHKPNLIIVHAEASGNFKNVVELCHGRDVRVGVALLPATPPEAIFPAVRLIDHVLIFSGELGSYGGQADTSLLSKAKILKERNAALEIGWDGGISDQNVSELVSGGVDVLNVGGFIQKSDDPEKAFTSLERIAEETGTT